MMWFRLCLKLGIGGLILFIHLSTCAQDKQIKGQIFVDGIAKEGIIVQLQPGDLKDTSNSAGGFNFKQLSSGSYQILVLNSGFDKIIRPIQLNDEDTMKFVTLNLQEALNQLNTIVVSATRTQRKKTDAPVLVHIMDQKALQRVQACNLSEGLKFQAGLRVETDCQTCNYTQLRMNGLPGSYSQILVNGRPLFSPLMGMYGLEQFPVNMIDRIEIIRGGGSTLYGSSAIAGTVNIITKIPNKKEWELFQGLQLVDGKSWDYQLNAQANWINQKRNAGVSSLISFRKRQAYDIQEDGFSELPELNNRTVGLQAFWKPGNSQKIELQWSNIREYRYGGDLSTRKPHLAQQAEERLHQINLLSLDYQNNFSDALSWIIYSGLQHTYRTHYTGSMPDDSIEIIAHLNRPPYGQSNNLTFQGGTQLNWKPTFLFHEKNIFTIGAEYVQDKIFDEIESYNYLVNQRTRNLGMFLQSDWNFLPQWTLLSGLRYDIHNFLQKDLISPRLALMFKPQKNIQYRISYGSGFRAPQAFDMDLHMSFAGGGVSRIRIDPQLRAERSNSWHASLNADRYNSASAMGLTAEIFYTSLSNAFTNREVGQDSIGIIFEKTNESNASVYGVTLETRLNYQRKWQWEAALTMQKAQYQNSIPYLLSQSGRNFLRTPEYYGYANLSWTPFSTFFVHLNSVLTGPMQLLHMGGTPEQATDTLKTSPTFLEWSLKVSQSFLFPKWYCRLEWNAGIKNMFNAYQQDFDSSKYRDSNYIYGPAAPRTFYVGVRLKSL